MRGVKSYNMSTSNRSIRFGLITYEKKKPKSANLVRKLLNLVHMTKTRALHEIKIEPNLVNATVDLHVDAHAQHGQHFAELLGELGEFLGELGKLLGELGDLLGELTELLGELSELLDELAKLLELLGVFGEFYNVQVGE